MRRTTSLAALLLGASLLAPTGAAHTAGETCRGEAATIVGTGPDVHGTEGRDVIVTGASHRVFAGAGDDVVCVTGAAGGASIDVVTVDAGAGDDVVDSTAMALGFYLIAILGDGSDIFAGGAGRERVVAGAASGPYANDVHREAERDVIETGDGRDSVTSGGPGLPNHDEIRTGSGNDHVTWSGTMAVGSVLDAGEGDDLLIPRASGQTFRVDLAARTLTRNGVREASFTSFERLQVVAEPDLGTLKILGTPGDDKVDVEAAAAMQTDLGGGDDSLGLAGTTADSRIDLGPGTDRISVRTPEGSVGLDLAKGSLVLDGTARTSIAGVEHASISAKKARVSGNGRANNLFVSGCRATVDGRGGNDRVWHGSYDHDTGTEYECGQGRTTLRGGAGNDKISGGPLADRINGGPGHDRLMGSQRADVLLGGKGKDRAVGGPGRDRCRAEIRKSCER